MSRMIPKNVLEDIRARNDIVDTIGAYLPLKRAGSGYKAACPFHKEKTPSFHVNPQRQIYRCFGCGAAGDVFNFVMEYEGVDFGTAVQMLARRAGVTLTFEKGGDEKAADRDVLYKLHEEIALFFHRILTESKAGEPARQYLQERALDDKMTEKFLLGYAPDRRNMLLNWAKKKAYTPQQLEAAGLIAAASDDGRGFYDRFRNRLMFPIHDVVGRVIGFSGRILSSTQSAAKYLNTPETALFQKRRMLFGLDKAKRPLVEARQAVICEGQFDVIRCHQAGVETAVAPQGTALTADHATLLKRYADEVILVFDADRAGQDAALRSGTECLQAGLSTRIATLPAGTDPDGLIREAGGDAFREILDAAKWLIDFQMDILREREDLTTETGLLRARHAIRETILQSPLDVQRDWMLRRASVELGVNMEALRKDLGAVRHGRKRDRASVSKAASPAVRRPVDEVAVAEILVAYPELKELASRYLPLESLTDPDCRTIVEQLLAHAGEVNWNLMSELTDASEECRRLAASVLSAPDRSASSELPPEHAMQDYIVRIRRKHLERQRTALRKKAAHAERGTGAVGNRVHAAYAGHQETEHGMGRSATHPRTHLTGSLALAACIDGEPG